jgi:hypothetical protein
MAASKKKVWFGFLEAGAKASPVVRDSELDTGDPKTVYLFNSTKGKILEYRRDIVEVKLRDLADDELPMVPELRKAYKQVRETFEPRSTRPHRQTVRATPAPPEDEIPDFEDADDVDFEDDFPLLGEASDEGAPADRID